MSTTSALDSAYSNALGSAISSSTGGSDLGKEEFLQLLGSPSSSIRTR